jgi:PhnB protein
MPVKPIPDGYTSVAPYLFVDAAFARAIDAGATAQAEPSNQFWGDRLGRLKDPFGHHWLLATRVEDLSPDEIASRGKELFAGAPSR